MWKFISLKIFHKEYLGCGTFVNEPKNRYIDILPSNVSPNSIDTKGKLIYILSKPWN